MEFLIHKDAATHYKLCFYDKDRLWLNDQEGRGMTITGDQIFEMFDKFFKENY